MAAASTPPDRRNGRSDGRRAVGRRPLVRLLRTGLPLVIGAMAAVMLLAPFAKRPEVSFLLSKDKVAMARERLRVTSAQYRGQDNLGRNFVLIADSAVQRSSAVPVVEMRGLSGAIALSDGPATITSPTAAYDMDAQQVAVAGPLRVAGGDGYRLETSAVTLDLNARTLTGRGGVSGSLNLGNFSADRLSANLDARVLRLEGNARLRINQGVLR